MTRFFLEDGANWRTLQELPNRPFVCGFCDTKISSVKGYKLGNNGDGSGRQIGGLYVCPNCGGPTFVAPDGSQYPKSALGNTVQNVPDDLYALYDEARRSSSQGCFTGSVLLCRKMLMNIAVKQGAREGLKFIEYVNFIADKGFVPPNGKHWVDHIRKKGNEATHEIAVMGEQDARDLISFIEMLLRFIFEFPSMVPIAAKP
jgi:hypothetical protein